MPIDVPEMLTPVGEADVRYNLKSIILLTVLAVIGYYVFMKK